MKEYANLEARSLKIRGKFNDKLVTDGGFYSGQLGEVAYKSEVPPGPSYFYGLVIKTSGTAYSFDAINTISFDPVDFYLTQPTGATDEVKVELRRKAFNATRAGDADVSFESSPLTPNTTPATWKFYWRHVIPANTLITGKIMKVTLIGVAQYSTSAGAVTNFIDIAVNGKRVIQCGGPAYANQANDTPLYDEFFFIQSSANTLQVMTKQLKGSRVAGGDIGDLGVNALLNTMAHSGDIASSPAIDRIVTFYTVFETQFTGMHDRYFTKVEYLT